MAVPVGVDLAELYVELSYLDAVGECRRRPLLDCVTARFEDVAARPAPAIDDSTRALIDAMLAERLDRREIWTRLMDDHEISVSYSSINVYFRTRPPPAGFISES
ncbi:hypothetical protein [Streptomyces sp. HNM1019]|uniref:hypothetical protein n=1 Tax=Streptomyces sp. HNM1019 TaxID=3424717 RepID=UPI003D77C8B5